MHNMDGNLRRCLYCGRQFVPINGNASFCSFGHYQMYNRGDVHHDEPQTPFVPNSSFTHKPFSKLSESFLNSPVTPKRIGMLGH